MREIRIRQMRYDDAKVMLQEELNRAFVEGISRVAVLHGIGDGILKKMTEKTARETNFVRIIPLSEIPFPNPGMTYLDILIADRSYLEKHLKKAK